MVSTKADEVLDSSSTGARKNTDSFLSAATTTPLSPTSSSQTLPTTNDEEAVMVITKEDMEAAATLLLLRQPRPTPLPIINRSAVFYEETCALLGCSIQCSPPSPYCFPDHEKLALILSDQTRSPYHILGGFHTIDERDKTCASLVVQRSKNIETGLPCLHQPDFFTKLPSELDDLLWSDGTRSCDHIFFHQKMSKSSSLWTPSPRRFFNMGSYSIFATTFTLHQPSSWTLYRYENDNKRISLYCLSYSTGNREAKLKKFYLLNEEEEEEEEEEEFQLKRCKKKSVKKAI